MAISKNSSAGGDRSEPPFRRGLRPERSATWTRIVATAVPLLALCSCGGPTAQEKAAQADRDVAAVEAVQKLHPPVVPVVPEPMKAESRLLYNLTADGCDFLPAERPNDDPVLIAGKAKALLLVAGQAEILAADSGSRALPFGAFSKYTARDRWVQLTQGEPAAGKGRWLASLTIRDRFERIVYFSAGELACHA